MYLAQIGEGNSFKLIREIKNGRNKTTNVHSI
jgi:hypothetical protein